MKIACLLLLLLSSILFNTSYAQRIDSTLALYANNYQPEQAYIQFDKPLYASGETVWFKAYLLAGALPSGKSKTCYADWYDSNGRLLTHSVLPIIESGAAGSFTIPDSLPTSAVYIKAYTAWMLNFGTGFLFEKAIPVINKHSSAVRHDTGTNLSSLQFFPEGGNAVQGLPSRIAFLASDEYGQPAEIKGFITNKRGDIIDTLRTEYDGMGSIQIIPANNETYTAKWTDRHNQQYETNLPTALRGGISLQVLPKPGKQTFIISRTEEVTGDMHQLHLVATMHQQLVYMSNINLINEVSTSGVIDTKDLPDGILQLTVFNSNWQPLAERICFINNNVTALTPQLQFITTGLAKRAENKLEITLPDSIAANLSIAVTDVRTGIDTNANIISHLLLSGELKGYIPHPPYYLSANNNAVAHHLDLLMLTHGWRRYNWSAITSAQMPTIKYPAEDEYIMLQGKLVGANKKQLNAHTKLFAVLTAADSSRQTTAVDINADGSFQDPNVILFDSSTLLLQFSNKAASFALDVQINTRILPPQKGGPIAFNRQPLPYASIDTTQRLFAAENAALQERLQSTTLAGVTVKTRALTPVVFLDKRYTRGVFQSGNAYQFDVTQVPEQSQYRNVFDYLNNKIGQVTATNVNGEIVAHWKGGKTTIYLDESPIPARLLYDMPVSKLAYVKAYASFIGNYGGAGSAIAVYTRKGADRPVQKGVFYKTVPGYTIVKEFYSPDYNTTHPDADSTDARSTLYWNSNIQTARENNKITLAFFNNDISHDFRVVMEGITSEGKLIHVEKLVTQ